MTKKRAALWTVATIVGPLLLLGFFSWLYIGIWYARTGHQGPPPSSSLIESMFVSVPPGLWATLGLWWWIHRRKGSFGDVFLARSDTIAVDIAIGIGLGLLWVVAYGLLDVVSWDRMFAVDGAKLASVPMSLSAGFCEEFLYRGFLFWVIAAAGGGKAPQLIISSAAFGLGHVFWGPWGMLATTVLGFTFGLTVLWRGNVWPAVGAHTILNLCIEPGLMEKAFSGGFGG